LFGLAGLPLALWLLFLVFQIYLQIFFAAPKKTREQLEAELAETRKQLAGGEPEEAWSVKVGAIAKIAEGKLGVVTDYDKFLGDFGDQVQLRFADGEESGWIKADSLTQATEAEWKEAQAQEAEMEEDVPTKPQPEPEPQPQPQPEAYSKEAKTSEQLEADPVKTQGQLTEMEEGVPTKPQPEPEPEPEPEPDPQAYSKEAAGP